MIEQLFIDKKASIFEVLKRLAAGPALGLPAGIALVVDDQQRIIGTVTDGDVRRALLASNDTGQSVENAMTSNPITFPENISHREILRQLPAELERRGRRSLRFLGKIVLVDDNQVPVRVLDYHQLWEQRVATHRRIVVVGLGYVGLTLALELAREGFHVAGVDNDESRINMLRDGKSYVHEIGLPELLREELNATFFPQTSLPEQGDVYVVSVGTPVGGGGDDDENDNDNDHSPQLHGLVAAAEDIGARLQRGNLVVLRSTVPIGATREIVCPILEKHSGLRAGTDFHLAFAPERTAEGRALYELRTLPQVIGGINEDSVEATAALFRELTPTLVRVDSLEAAELVKLINNCYRDLTFAFANEMVHLAQPWNLDVVKTIEAANRGYTRGQIPLPSPGVGGPCLTKDPYILKASASRAGLKGTLSERGRQVNEAMLDLVADTVIEELRTQGKDPAAARVVICGLAFKGEPETGDLRNSTTIEIANRLKPRVGSLHGHDPVATDDEIREFGLQPVELPVGFQGADAVLFLNNHRHYEQVDVFSLVRAMAAPGIVYDGWHLFDQADVLAAAPCVYLGLGFRRSSAER